MFTSFNGIGFNNYGKTDERSDGSFVTTEWFCFLFFPVFPVRRIRVKERMEPCNMGKTSSRVNFVTLEELPYSLPQILATYLFAILSIAWWLIALWFIIKFESHYTNYTDFEVLIYLGAFSVMAFPFFVLWLLRCLSRYVARKHHQNSPSQHMANG